MSKTLKGSILIPANLTPWPHEMRVARILALAGHEVKFIPTATIGAPDIYVDQIAYEIKSPKSGKTNTIEHRIKDAISHQSRNIIIDSSRIKNLTDRSLQSWLISKCRIQPKIQRMLLINKKGQIIDIKSLI